MKAVIMAGGRGSRMAGMTGDLPKPMLPAGGRPVLVREIESLREQGFCEIILTVSYKKEIIMDYFGDGSDLGVSLDYFVEEEPLGNAGALFRMRDRLTDDFLLLNGDAVFDVDFKRFVRFHRQKNALVTLFTHPNDHPYDSGLLLTDGNGAVTGWLAKEDARPAWYANRVNAGLHILSPEVLDRKVDGSKIDLDRQVLKPLAGTGRMFAYQSPEYVRDMGTPERYEAVCADFDAGRVTSRSLLHQQKAVFLDRDGTINKYAGFLRNIDDFELLPGVCEAVRRINRSGYLAIVVTNQPVIARGEVTREQLEQIHNKMETLLGEQGAYLDAIYYCPHHPDRGYAGEIPELKMDCDCRKPKPGLLLEAAKDFNIDLSCSWMVGDSKSDILAGQAAGCKTALLGEGEYGQTVTAEGLLAFTEKYLER